MALGDLMASRFAQSSLAVVSNHYDDFDASSHAEEDAVADLATQRRDSDTASSSYGNAIVAASTAASTTTSMAYLPQTVVLGELRHDSFEASMPAGPSDSGLVSKWRHKDRVSPIFTA